MLEQNPAPKEWFEDAIECFTKQGWRVHHFDEKECIIKMRGRQIHVRKPPFTASLTKEGGEEKSGN